MIETINRSEYDRLKRHDYAGTRESLLPDTRKDWPGTHWIMRAGKCGGVELVPVNVGR